MELFIVSISSEKEVYNKIPNVHIKQGKNQSIAHEKKLLLKEELINLINDSDISEEEKKECLELLNPENNEIHGNIIGSEDFIFETFEHYIKIRFLFQSEYLFNQNEKIIKYVDECYDKVFDNETLEDIYSSENWYDKMETYITIMCDKYFNKRVIIEPKIKKREECDS